ARAVVIGPKTNLAFLSALLSAREVEAGAFDTVFIDANASRLGAEPREADPRAILAGAEALIAAPASRQARGPAHDPWNVADSFELTGPRRVGCEVRVEGHVERLVAIDDNGRRTLAFADGRALGADEAAPQTVLATGEAAFVLRAGRQIRVVRVDPLAGGLAGPGESSGEIAAPMHGRVIALHVEEGERVEEGARLAVVEAMKMEHALVAPRAGRVANLTARVGDTAEQGQRLMTIEAQEG
ncbi:MAG TPA: biotin/lipoyl-containing protein, partial [Roseiarcus sp.]|nr:biotin/lipoyl-containing protein [Roseiarcus sp.]